MPSLDAETKTLGATLSEEPNDVRPRQARPRGALVRGWRPRELGSGGFLQERLCKRVTNFPEGNRNLFGR